MENKIFRKSALDKISSPEELNEYMKVAGPGVWVIMAALMVTFAAFFVWGFLGSIPETVEISGTVLAIEDGPVVIYSFLPLDEAHSLEPGMEVRISPGYAPKEQFGYIYGTIRTVGRTPVTTMQMLEELGENAQFVTLPASNAIQVMVAMRMDVDGTPAWSAPAGKNVDLTLGSVCQLTVVTAERKPYELMVN